MSFATLEEVAIWDEDGNVEGLQFDGRERRIQEWKEKQEEKEFEKLLQALRNRNRVERLKNEDRDGYRRMREVQDEWRRQNRKRVNELSRLRRKRKYQEDPVVCTCGECGAVWSVPYEKKNQKARKFCDNKCRMKHYSRESAKRRNRGLRKMNVRQQIIETLSKSAMTADEVAEAIGHKAGTTRTLCSRMAKEGVLHSSGGRPATYSICNGDDRCQQN